MSSNVTIVGCGRVGRSKFTWPTTFGL